jgi:hypothetical protein
MTAEALMQISEVVVPLSKQSFWVSSEIGAASDIPSAEPEKPPELDRQPRRRREQSRCPRDKNPLRFESLSWATNSLVNKTKQKELKKVSRTA